jgi:hypothetical protein
MCLHERPPTSQSVALDAAGFHVVWHFFHLQPSAPLHAMLAAGRDWCDTPWAAVDAGDCDSRRDGVVWLWYIWLAGAGLACPAWLAVETTRSC